MENKHQNGSKKYHRETFVVHQKRNDAHLLLAALIWSLIPFLLIAGFDDRHRKNQAKYREQKQDGWNHRNVRAEFVAHDAQNGRHDCKRKRAHAASNSEVDVDPCIYIIDAERIKQRLQDLQKRIRYHVKQKNQNEHVRQKQQQKNCQNHDADQHLDKIVQRQILKAIGQPADIRLQHETKQVAASNDDADFRTCQSLAQ